MEEKLQLAYIIWVVARVYQSFENILFSYFIQYKYGASSL